MENLRRKRVQIIRIYIAVRLRAYDLSAESNIRVIEYVFGKICDCDEYATCNIHSDIFHIRFSKRQTNQ